MSSRLFPPPPLIAPTPSNVRPPAVPLMVMVVLVAADAVTAVRPPTAKTVNTTLLAAHQTRKGAFLGAERCTVGPLRRSRRRDAQALAASGRGGGPSV